MHAKTNARKNYMDILYTRLSKIIIFSSNVFYKFLVNFRIEPLRRNQFFVSVVIYIQHRPIHIMKSLF